MNCAPVAFCLMQTTDFTQAGLDTTLLCSIYQLIPGYDIDERACSSLSFPCYPRLHGGQTILGNCQRRGARKESFGIYSERVNEQNLTGAPLRAIPTHWSICLSGQGMLAKLTQLI